jgi:hypothetical protein
MKISFDIDPDALARYTDEHLAACWWLAQTNPAPFGDTAACDLAERIGREIVRRWLSTIDPPLWTHQGHHRYLAAVVNGE